ncbi:hypothetical protein [Rhodophyticola porphyridii]|uniref:hypothetical protein n=1 Tax=Rhodophyticola porphyridii TaxID=1852017 RepID=UPI0011C451EB|nr:hypothetical protein [Rhodophyticola porphyridii]
MTVQPVEIEIRKALEALVEGRRSREDVSRWAFDIEEMKYPPDMSCVAWEALGALSVADAIHAQRLPRKDDYLFDLDYFEEWLKKLNVDLSKR